MLQIQRWPTSKMKKSIILILMFTLSQFEKELISWQFPINLVAFDHHLTTLSYFNESWRVHASCGRASTRVVKVQAFNSAGVCIRVRTICVRILAFNLLKIQITGGSDTFCNAVAIFSDF